MFVVYMYKNIDMLNQNTIQNETKRLNPLTNTNKCINTCLANKTLKDYKLKSSKSPVESLSCRHRRISFLLCKWETILFRPPLASFDYIANVCVGVRGTRVSVQVSTNLEWLPIMGNWGVIRHLCLMDFILLRHIKNGFEPEIGSGVRLCMGKALGTPPHPLKKWLPPF